MNPYRDDDLIALADRARRFATDRIAPGFQERDRTRVLKRGDHPMLDGFLIDG